MQIGFPTDVKHVAHIGWDGPAVSSPSWMNEFRASPEGSSISIGSDLTKDKSSKKLTSQDSTLKNAPKPSRRRTSKGDASTSFDSINKESNESIRKNPSRRQRSGDSSESTRPSRRNGSMEEGTDSTVYGQDSSSIPKQSKKKNKSKGSSRSGDGGSTRSRSKGSDLPNINEDGPVSPFMALKLED